MGPELIQLRHVREVHPVLAGNQRRRGQHGRPACQLFQHLVLRGRRQRQVHTGRRPEHLAHRVDRFIHAKNVIVKIAEVSAQQTS